jgi:hypothetical protein
LPRRDALAKPKCSCCPCSGEIFALRFAGQTISAACLRPVLREIQARYDFAGVKLMPEAGKRPERRRRSRDHDPGQNGAVSRDYVAAHTHIESLRAAGRLGENDVAAFATADQFEETRAALAALFDLAIEAVERAMVQERPETALIMAKAIGMSWPTAKATLRMHAGACGISSREIEQCLGTFSRLKAVTARQVTEFQRRRSRDTQFDRPTA